MITTVTEISRSDSLRKLRMTAREISEKSMTLQDRCALVTGASRGIGAAIASALAASGAAVAVNYMRCRDDAEAVVNRIIARGGRAAAVHCDVSNVKDHRALLNTVAENLGPADILFNNAAIDFRKAFTEVKEDDYDKILSTNLRGAFFLSQAFAETLIERNSKGRIINVSSTHEWRPMPGNALYNISKAGLGMLTKSLAIDLAPHGITVNGLIPGAILTDLNRAVLADRSYEQTVRAKIPLGWIADPCDLADAAVFLAGDGARYMTGSSITLDGGLSL